MTTTLRAVLVIECFLSGVFGKASRRKRVRREASRAEHFLGASKPIDAYHEGRRYGVSKEKPTYQATQWWRDLLAKLEAKKPDCWMEVWKSAWYCSVRDMRSKWKSNGE